MNDADRIKLAEAMFPDWEFMQNTVGDWLMCHKEDSEGRSLRGVPTPATDANDDVAVLEWFRAKYGARTKEHREFGDEMLSSEWGMPAYVIGDYARAALKVLP